MERCKANASRGTNVREATVFSGQCKRRATKDGYCWQHHPDTVKKREEMAAKKLEATPISWLIYPRK